MNKWEEAVAALGVEDRTFEGTGKAIDFIEIEDIKALAQGIMNITCIAQALYEKNDSQYGETWRFINMELKNLIVAISGMKGIL